jgi:membrane protein implicated in regulation of membrane protease activity
MKDSLLPWSGPGVFLVCLILAAIVTVPVIHAPNTYGGRVFTGAVVVIVALIFRGTFQFLMRRRQKRKDERLKRDESHESHVA